MTQIARRRIQNPQREHLDSIGLGKVTDMQMKAIVDFVKQRRLLEAQKVPEPTGDRGIVVAGGGKYLDWAWVNCRWMRHHGIEHPIQVWFMGPKEMPPWARPLFAKLDVELIDAYEVRERFWHRNLKSWFVKQYAMMHAPWQNVAFYDADCFAALDPSNVWDDPEYQAAGALFFSDVKPCRHSDWVWVFASVRIPDHEMESGVFFWDRVKAWSGIRFCNWINEHNEVWCKHIHGEKDTPILGFGTTSTPYIQSTERRWMGWGIEQGWKGQVVANHIMATKRKEHAAHSPLIPGFFEEWRSLTL